MRLVQLRPDPRDELFVTSFDLWVAILRYGLGILQPLSGRIDGVFERSRDRIAIAHRAIG